MQTVTGADLDRMVDAVFIDGGWRGPKATRFWMLLGLASVIATAGLVADSTATVIGAMIVAPLMTPILGTALGVVLADRRGLLRSLGYVVGGALVVIAIAFLIGVLASPPDAYVANGQISARIHPRLIDLLAALATGTVGAFALARSDVSDTLPGVAIAISLVPPLAVVGLLLQVQRYGDALGAFLLFATNVTAIVATGTAVLLAYRVRGAAEANDRPVGRLRGRTLAVVVACVVVVAVPLAAGSLSVARDQQITAKAEPVASQWAAEAGWQVTLVSTTNRVVTVTALGPPPEVSITALRKDLDAAGLSDADLVVNLVVGGRRYCPAGSRVCSATPPSG